jgi:hypothetical protein
MAEFTITELEAALDRHGADVERWPTDLRVAALELIANSEMARGIVERAQSIERTLRQPPKAPRGLADRIVSEALRQSPPKPRSRPKR